MSDELLGVINLDHSPIPDGCLRALSEVTIKRDGEVWRIHKSDADPFPSNPHAHNLESGLKLDLRNGRLWLGTKHTGDSVSKKDLLTIREKAAGCGIELPPLCI